MQYSKGKSCSFLKITRQQLNKVVHFQHPPRMLISIRISTCIPAAPHFTFFVPPPSRNDNNQVEEKQFSGLSTSLSRERVVNQQDLSGRCNPLLPFFPTNHSIVVQVQLQVLAVFLVVWDLLVEVESSRQDQNFPAKTLDVSSRVVGRSFPAKSLLLSPAKRYAFESSR